MSSHRYRLHSTNTFAAVIVRNDDRKLLSRLGHDHVVRADGFTSTVAVDPGHPESLRFALSFAAESLIVDAPEDRKRVGFEPEVADRDRKMTRDNMLAKGQLHARRYGNIDVHINGARPSPDDEWLLDVGLTVRQQRFDFEFPVTVDFSPHLRVSGRVDITHEDLGLKPYKAPMGALRNQQQLTFVIDVDAAPL